MRWWLIVAMATGCAYLGDEKYEEKVGDADGDGELSIAFGGADCQDRNPKVTVCDADGDGENSIAAGGEDCDDEDAGVHPAASEVCDGKDNDCDALIDDRDELAEEHSATFYADADDDGIGGDVTHQGCEPPKGFVEVGGDCDDSRDDVAPTMPELCDDIDHDCDGDPLDGATNKPTWYEDLDGDGFGGPEGVASCDRPPDTVQLSDDCDDADDAISPAGIEACYDGIDQDCDGLEDDVDCDGDGAIAASEGGDDCDDADPDVNPSATEVCGGGDEDCDGLVDDDDDVDPSSATAWFPDTDGDGHGEQGATPVLACTAPPQTAADDLDCDDTRDTFAPGVLEFCDGQDNDCDGSIDNAAVDAVTFWADTDGDGFGASTAPIQACVQPSTAVTNDQDCNDADDTVYPGATEVCWDTIRQDCLPADLNDCDADGVVAVEQGGTDCDDADPTVLPGALEVCDGVDNDCNGDVDDDDTGVDVTTQTDWYLDDDDDQFGDGAPVTACDAPLDHVAADGDCDDAEPLAYPGADELCDGFDNDCDGGVDLGIVVNPPTFYADSDGDGFGDPAITAVGSCFAPATGVWVLDGNDCDDIIAAANPGAVEACDGVDNDCNGNIDDNAVDADTYWLDNDGDGFGAASLPIQLCSLQPGSAANADDCNDADDGINPGATEICYDAIRQDCALADLNDCDADGVLDINHGGTDCDDTNPAVLPGAAEICNGLDDDCDTLFDDDDPDVQAGSSVDWFPDDDNDGYGQSGSPINACSQPTGHVLLDGDCDDDEPLANPGADETCDGIDNDCDSFVDIGTVVGAPTFYEDVDDDTFGDPASTVTDSCFAPPGNWVLNGDDCVDNNDAVNPNATEVCNSLDDDCDGDVDDDDPDVTGRLTWEADNDGDGYSLPTSSTLACFQPVGFIAATPQPDCNDNNVAVNPGADEICNAGVDDDCDGDVDAADLSVVDQVDWYPDTDGDGFGADGPPVIACNTPQDHVGVDGDCLDNNSAVNPDADEVCNSLDDDCNSLTDDNDPGLTNATVWYHDSDGDDFGDDADSVTQCAQPADHVLVGGDCDDAVGAINPDADELCAAGDEDCDGLDGDDDPSVTDASVWHADFDGDGYDDPSAPTTACVAPGGAIDPSAQDDCNDNNDAIHPNAPEICNGGTDDDCDGNADADDNDVVDVVDWYADLDNDTFGDLLTTLHQCGQPAGYVANSTDCDDGDPLVNPGTRWYGDIDGDGYADAADELVQCVQPVDYILGPTGDCDDDAPGINPGAPEACDGADVDENCNLLADDADPTLVKPSMIIDFDGDGFGDAAGVPVFSCELGATHVEAAVGSDCDDDDKFISPAEIEVPYDGIDNDCDGIDLVDVDGDGFASDGVTGGTDCDDDDPLINPAASEIWYDTIDQDCDGNRHDQDGDGYTAIGAPEGSADDCDDDPSDDPPDLPDLAQFLAVNIHPGAPDAPYDGSNQDCGVYDADAPADGNEVGNCRAGDPEDDWDEDEDCTASILPDNWPWPYTGSLTQDDCNDDVDNGGATIYSRDIALPDASYPTIQSAIDVNCAGVIDIPGTGCYIESLYVGIQSPVLRGDGIVVGASSEDCMPETTIRANFSGSVLFVNDDPSPVTEFVGFRPTSHVTVQEIFLYQGAASENEGAGIHVGEGQVVDMVDSASNGHLGFGRGGGVYVAPDATFTATAPTGLTSLTHLGAGQMPAVLVDDDGSVVLDGVSVNGTWIPDYGVPTAGGLTADGASLVDVSNVRFIGNNAAGTDGYRDMVLIGDANSNYIVRDSTVYSTTGSSIPHIYAHGSVTPVRFEGMRVRTSYTALISDGYVELDSSVFTSVNAAAVVHNGGLLDVLHSVFLYNNPDPFTDDQEAALTLEENTNLSVVASAFIYNYSDFSGIRDVDWDSNGLLLFEYLNNGHYAWGTNSVRNGPKADPTVGSAGSDCDIVQDVCDIGFAGDQFQTWHRDLDPQKWDMHLRPGALLKNGGRPASVFDDPDGTREDIGIYDASEGAWYFDLDSDGLPDGWEADHGVDDPFANPDSDFRNNLSEYNAGTDPNDADTDNDGTNDFFDSQPLNPNAN